MQPKSISSRPGNCNKWLHSHDLVIGFCTTHVFEFERMRRSTISNWGAPSNTESYVERISTYKNIICKLFLNKEPATCSASIMCTICSTISARQMTNFEMQSETKHMSTSPPETIRKLYVHLSSKISETYPKEYFGITKKYEFKYRRPATV